MTDQFDPFRPQPIISGADNLSGLDVWRHPTVPFLTTDLSDLDLTFEQLIEKYGTVETGAGAYFQDREDGQLSLLPSSPCGCSRSHVVSQPSLRL